MAALPNFRIATIDSESGTTIKLSGELDSATCTVLLERFEVLAGAPGVRHLVLDLSDVTFIDSAGMRAIILIEQAATEDALTLAISPPPPEVTELLQAAGIVDRLTPTPHSAGRSASAPFIERIELELARNPGAPARARAELREALANRIPEADRATLTLLTSELVTNAVIHPPAAVEGSVGLRITEFPDRVRVEVSDAGSGFELENLPPRPREAGGHGLFVVEGLSSRWGTSRRADGEGYGFCVWFELDVDYEPDASAGVREPAKQSVAAVDG